LACVGAGGSWSDDEHRDRERDGGKPRIARPRREASVNIADEEPECPSSQVVGGRAPELHNGGRIRKGMRTQTGPVNLLGVRHAAHDTFATAHRMPPLGAAEGPLPRASRLLFVAGG